MTPTGTGHAATLWDYLQVLRRRRWIILQAVVLIPLTAVLLSARQEKLYQGTSEVLLGRQNLATSLTGAQNPDVYVQADRLAQTQAAVARVGTVARGALQRAGVTGRTPQELLARSSVDVKQNADLLVFKVTDPRAPLARRLADAYARSYTAYRRQLDTASIVRARRSVQGRLQALVKAGDRRSPLYSNLVGRDQQLAEMQALLTSQAYVVQQSGRPAQVQPKPVRNGILGLALGIVVGLGLAFLREALDTRVRNAEEIGEKLGLPLLGRVPQPPRALRSDHKLVMLTEPGGLQAETFRMLRTNLEFATLDRDARVVIVTSAVGQEGKSTTIANLAVALARAGRRVVLVDLDLRRPFIDTFFGTDGPGVTQVALGHVSLDQALARIAISEPFRLDSSSSNGNVTNGNGKGHPRPALGVLEVLPSGPTPPDPGEFVGTHALGEILRRLRDRADIVLVDTPPVLHVGDAMTLSTQVDGIIVVTRMNVVRRHMLRDLARQLATAPAAKLGFVVTGAGEEDGYGQYGYGQYGYGQNGHRPGFSSPTGHEQPTTTKVDA